MSIESDLTLPDRKPRVEGNYRLFFVNVASETILYLKIPFKGCTVSPICSFCGLQELPQRNLSIDRHFGDLVFQHVREWANASSPDSVFVYNDGNILRPEEMWQPTVEHDIPQFVVQHQTLKAYEIEARVDDVIQCIGRLQAIQARLGGKQLRIRLGIEFFDDPLLERHRKGVNTMQIQQAIDLLNASKIQWIAYVLLGGLDMSREEARQVAIKTGRFVIDNSGFWISINGMFVTERLMKGFGKRIYVPDEEDLIFVLEKLCSYKTEKSSGTLLKIGFDEEDPRTILTFPYVKSVTEIPKISALFRRFNVTQNPECLLSR